MKKLLCLLPLLLLAVLAACGGGKTPAADPDPTPLDLPDVTPIAQETPTPGAEETPDPEEAPTPTPVKELTLEELWDQVEGYWTYGNQFFVVFYRENGTCWFNHADWYSEFPRNDARATELRQLSDRSYQVGLYYDASSSEEWGDLEPLVSTLVIDLGPAGDNKISVRVEDQTLYEYAFAGRTMEAALEKIAE